MAEKRPRSLPCAQLQTGKAGVSGPRERPFNAPTSWPLCSQPCSGPEPTRPHATRPPRPHTLLLHRALHTCCPWKRLACSCPKPVPAIPSAWSVTFPSEISVALTGSYQGLLDHHTPLCSAPPVPSPCLFFPQCLPPPDTHVSVYFRSASLHQPVTATGRERHVALLTAVFQAPWRVLGSHRSFIRQR